MNNLLIILPVTLFDYKTIKKDFRNVGNISIVIYEHPEYFTKLNFHKSKILFHRSSMKCYYDEMKNNFDILYLNFYEKEKLLNVVKKFDNVFFYDPCDHSVEKDLMKIIKNNFIILDSHNFICKKEDLKEFLNLRKTNKKIIQQTFYSWQRNRMKIEILDKNKIFNYDHENRKKIPEKNLEDLKKVKMINLKNDNIALDNSSNIYYIEAKKYVQKYFSQNPGAYDNLIFPYNRKLSKKHFKTFLKNDLKYFGTYQDFIDFDSNSNPSLYHSLITPMMNVGLLTPLYIVNKTIKFAENNKIPPNSLEGFIRQIIGWREFIRFNYSFNLIDTKSNYFNANKNLNKSWYNGTTNILPVDLLIKKVNKYGYLHHIERLMVIGNIMLIKGIKPKHVYKWFMEMFVDSYNWVMIPNVYEMSQFSQKRKAIINNKKSKINRNPFATRPYFSSSKYIERMSNINSICNELRCNIASENEWKEKWNKIFRKFVSKNKNKLKKMYIVSSFVKK